MKNIIKVLFLAFGLTLSQGAVMARTGDTVLGLFGGLLAGSLLTAAATSGSAKAESKVDKKIKEMEYKQEQDAKLNQLRREADLQREVETRLSANAQQYLAHQINQKQESSNGLMYLLLGLVALLTMVVIGLGMMVLRK